MYWEDFENYRPSAAVITAFEACRQSGREWSDQWHNDAKKLLRKELMAAQQGRCGYCRRLIEDDYGRLEIDHILPKAASKTQRRTKSNTIADRRQTMGYSGFTFVVWNLVLTCKRCNNKKGTYDCRGNRENPPYSSSMYNLDPNDFEWVHPYLHKYSEHIRVNGNIVYQARDGSPAGDAVIRACKLDEISAVEIAAREVVLVRNKNVYRAVAELIGNLELIGHVQLVNEVCQRFPDVERTAIEKAVREMSY